MTFRFISTRLRPPGRPARPSAVISREPVRRIVQAQGLPTIEDPSRGTGKRHHETLAQLRVTTS